MALEEYLKIYDNSEVEIRPTGEKIEPRKDPQPWDNEHLFAVHTKNGEMILPRKKDPSRLYLGISKHDCKSWIENYCSLPNDSFWFPNGAKHPKNYKPENIEIRPTGKICDLERTLIYGESLFILGIKDNKKLYEPVVGFEVGTGPGGKTLCFKCDNKYKIIISESEVNNCCRIRIDVQELEGIIENSCRDWLLHRRSRNTEDKPFKKDVLLKLINDLEINQQSGNLFLVDKCEDYCGSRHDEFHIIFKENDKYFLCKYVETEYGLSVGKWMSYKGNINSNWYLCKRVYPKKRHITEVFIEYCTEKSGL